MAHPTPGILPDDQTLSVTLDRYQELMRICICAFNGIARDPAEECCDCKQIWRQSDLDALAIALGQAEEMRERELGYFIAPKYIEDEEYEVECPLILDKKFIIEVGSKAVTVIGVMAITLSDIGGIIDPTISTIATTVTVESEIHVYFHGTDIEITPTDVSIAGGVVTITIPRCRLLDPDIDTNCTEPDYDDDANFVDSVDVKRVYTDPGDGLFKVWDSSCCDCTTAITETTDLQYAKIENKRLSIINKYFRASYSGGVWTRQCCSSLNCRPAFLRISYLSGRRSSVATEMETIMLAHVLLPKYVPDRLNLCAGCWQAHREKGDIATPYGNSVGAIEAWMADSRSKIGYGGKTPRVR